MSHQFFPKMDSEYEYDSDCADHEINSVVSTDEPKDVEEQIDLDDEFSESEADSGEVPDQVPREVPEQIPEVPEDIKNGSNYIAKSGRNTPILILRYDWIRKTSEVSDISAVHDRTNTAYKILSKILCRLLTPYARRFVGPYQAGFTGARATTDQIFSLRQILEECCEYNVPTHHIFIDFKAAYDTVDREQLWQITLANKK